MAACGILILDSPPSNPSLQRVPEVDAESVEKASAKIHDVDVRDERQKADEIKVSPCRNVRFEMNMAASPLLRTVFLF